MKTTILQLESHDDVISTRDKMTWSKTPRIMLVWPRRGKILQRKVDLVLLQRQGQQLGAQVALVTRDAQVIAHAREVGLPVFSSSRQAQRRPWGPRAPLPQLRPADQPAPGQEGLRQQKAALQIPANPFWQRQSVRLFTFLCGVIAVLALALFFYPSAQVRIQPARVTQALDVALRASPEFSTATTSGDIPARMVRLVVEGSAQRPTSGMTSAADSFASGSVRFTNLTTQSVRLPVGLVVRTLDDPPVRFALLETVEVPAGVGLTVDAPVRAQLPGSAGNLPAGSIAAINSEQGASVKVTNVEPLQGGTERLARSPSAADVEGVRAALLTSLRQQALDGFVRGAAAGEQVLPESVLISSVEQEEATPQISQPGDVLSLRMRVEYTALMVKTADLNQVITAGMDANLPGGFRVLDNTLTITPGDKMALETGGKALRWQIHAERQVEARWTEEGVIQAVLGRSLVSAAAEVQRRVPLQTEPRISVSPAFWQRLPYLPFRITVVAQ